MSIQSDFNIQVIFTGDLLQSQQFNSVSNTLSPGQWRTISLLSGNNTISLPAYSGALCIVPPTSNTTVDMTLKGVSGDTGVPLSRYSPSIIGIKSTTSTTGSVIITASTILDVRVGIL